MNVSLNWLKEYVNLDESISVKEIIDRLTMTGTKVEKVETFGVRTKNVYTARVESVKKHSEDEKLYILELNLGDKGIYKAVAKIPDIEVSDIVPVALPGAVVIGKEIKVGEVKGIKSECMVCHILDLGLSQKDFPWVKSSGLIAFPKDVEIGKDINDILGLGDSIIEFEITPNRPDCLSVEGIARELAVTFNTECKPLVQDMSFSYNCVDKVQNLGVKVESSNCLRYMLSVVDNITVGQLPYDMQIKLIKSGIRPINNIVDITNYVMLELGQPLHAFDYNKISGENIIIRQAKNNENVVTLDGVDRKLDETNLVIADANKVLAIAGVMGAESSAISDLTTQVAFEAATFVRGSVRNTSKKLILRTDASAKYEKGLATELVLRAIKRVLQYVSKICNIYIEDNLVDVYLNKQEEIKILLDYDKINKIIGENISKEFIDKTLKDLQFKIQDGYVIPPYYRQDVELIEDLAEEIARIYGFDKLYATLPDTSLTFGGKTDKQKMEDEVKNIAMANGYNEIYTYTFFSQDLLDRMMVEKDSNLRNCIKISNPLTQEFEYMRTTATPLMLEALERNYTKKNNSVKIFELGKIFLKPENILKRELPEEKEVLTLGAYDANKEFDFYEFKHTVEDILSYFGILDLEYDINRCTDRKLFHPGVSAKIILDNNIIATFGKLSPKVLQNYILPENTYIAEIDFEVISKYVNREMKYVELPKFPAVERDIAFIVSKDVLSYTIEKNIKSISNIIEEVKLFDVYEGKQIEENKKSVAYRIRLRSRAKTLEDTEINEIMLNVNDMLERKFSAIFRK